jgi:hypothetical protein
MRTVRPVQPPYGLFTKWIAGGLGNVALFRRLFCRECRTRDITASFKGFRPRRVACDTVRVALDNQARGVRF